MLLALLFATVSVALGLALGLTGREGSLGPVRAFAIGASLATVFGALLPEALSDGSPWTLLLFALGVVGPAWFEHLGRAMGQGAGRAGLEVGFMGLALHQLADGLAAGAMNEPSEHARLDVLLSMAGHTVPVVAAVVITFAERRGKRSATLRAFGLALAAGVGILLTSSPAAAAVVHTTMPFIAAAAAGLLLHVVFHGAGAHPPQTLGQRLVELGALLGGAWGVMALGGAEHEGHHGADGGAHDVFVTEVGALLVYAAPAMVVGLSVALAWLMGQPKPRRSQAPGLAHDDAHHHDRDAQPQPNEAHHHGEQADHHHHAHRPEVGWLARLDALVVGAVLWALVGVASVAALEATFAWVLFSGAGRPLVGLWIAGAIAWPLFSLVREGAGRRRALMIGSLLVALLVTDLILSSAGAAARLMAMVSGVVVAVLLLRVALLRGVRELFVSLMPSHEHEHDH